MARAIQFHAPSLPNFGEANDLTLKSMELGNNSIKSITDTWNNAVKAVENRNHAEMKQMIDAYNYQQLQDPNVINQVQNDIKRLGLETGNMYDPTVVQTYLDTRADTLLKREADKLAHQTNGLEYDIKNYGYDEKVFNDSVAKVVTAGSYPLRTQNINDPKSVADTIKQLNELIQSFPKEQRPFVTASIYNDAISKGVAHQKSMAELDTLFANIDKTKAQTNSINSLLPYEIKETEANIAFKNAQTETENSTRQGKIDGQTISNAVQEHKLIGEVNKPSEQITNIQKNLESRGFPMQAIDKDGNLNNNLLRNSVTTSVEVAKSKVNNQFDMSYIEWANKHKPDLIKASKIHPTKLEAFAHFLNEQHEKTGLTLKDRERIILETALIDGSLPIESILNGNFFGASINYGSYIEKLGKNYLKQNEAIDEERKAEVTRNTLITKISDLSNATGLSPIDIVQRGIVAEEYLPLLPDNFLPESMKEAIAKKRKEASKTPTQKLIDEESRYREGNKLTKEQKSQIKAPAIGGGTYGL